MVILSSKVKKTDSDDDIFRSSTDTDSNTDDT